MNDYLSKPVKMDALENVLGKWVPEQTAQGAKTPLAEAPSADVPVLDSELLETWRSLSNSSSEDFLAEIIEMFLSNTPKMISELREAFDQKDYQRLRALAHKMKGSSANLGACRLALVCSNLEEDSSKPVSAPIAPIIELVQSEYDLVSDRLRQDWIA